jgi:DHA1 family bicyclomycin/chloramphenicol resistance-like MFS transporter
VGVVIATCGASLVLISQALAWPAWPVIVGFGLTISSFGLISPNCMAMALADQGERAGSASAIIGSGRFAIGGLFAPIASVMAGIVVWGTGLVMLLLSALSLAILAFSYRAVRRRAPAMNAG